MMKHNLCQTELPPALSGPQSATWPTPAPGSPFGDQADSCSWFSVGGPAETPVPGSQTIASGSLSAQSTDAKPELSGPLLAVPADTQPELSDPQSSVPADFQPELFDPQFSVSADTQPDLRSAAPADIQPEPQLAARPTPVPGSQLVAPPTPVPVPQQSLVSELQQPPVPEW